MELYLQLGYGMKNISISLSKEWGNATAILSPRDMSPEQMVRWKNEFKKANIKTLFDPQYYFPKSQHKGLQLYNYFDASLVTKMEANTGIEEDVIKSVLSYNEMAECDSFIVPAVMLQHNEQWMSRWKKQCSKWLEATKKYVPNRKIYLTLTLPEAFLLQKEDEIENYIEEIDSFDVEGFYIIAQPPRSQYLVDRPMWLSNLMQICAALKLNGKKVIMGYGNHQLLCLSVAGIDGMATGTYLNVRRFSNKFEEDDDNFQRKSVWYYYPAALSEYKIGFLDIAYNAGVLQQMKPTKEMDKGYVDILFGGAVPTSTAFKETMAFMHYLNCVRVQTKNVSKKSFEETVNAHEVMLETAMRRIEYMERHGVYAQARSFKDMVDVNRSAIQRLTTVRGFQLKQEWNQIINSG